MASLLLTSNGYSANSGDNTSFRAYGTALSNAFANAGWVRANDAGQVNWTTVVANGSLGVWSATEIWRMSDALQSTSPVYVRVDYGTSSGTNRPGLAFTVGHSTNGALGLCGSLYPNTTIVNIGPGPTLYPWYFVGSNNYFGCVMWSAAANPILFGIERTKDANGADTGEGCYIFTYTGGGMTQTYWNIRTGPGIQENPGCALSRPSSPGWSQGTGTQFNWSPLYLSKGVWMPPSKLFAYGVTAQFAQNTVVQLTHYGANTNYLAVSGSASTPGMGSANRSGISSQYTQLFMLWE